MKKTPVTLKASFRDRLEEANSKALLGGGLKRIETQHSRGYINIIIIYCYYFRKVDGKRAHRTAFRQR